MSKLVIHNFRVGFATNSSSSHSVILLPPDLIGRVGEIDTDASYGYGWDFFRLVSPEQKLRYLAAQFFSNYGREEGQRDIRDTILRRFEELLPGYTAEVKAEHGLDYERSEWEQENYPDRPAHWYGPSVDHQSVFQFDREFNPKLLEDLIKVFQSDRVVVLGGNDNSDYATNTVDGADKAEFLAAFATDDGRYVMKEDGPYWIAFDPKKGTKLRFSIEPEDFSGAAYAKASTPELVDLKITNFCGKGCNFCYQSSTPEGLHAPLDEILKTLDVLTAMKVFEVAIGGGEPTDHPDFVAILHACRDRKIKPNFTTMSDRWLNDDAVVQAVKECVGGVGVSCHDKKGLRLVDAIKKKVGGWDGANVMAQHVFGSVPLDVTCDFINEAFKSYTPVLLLGYKEVGFGKDYARHDLGSNDAVATFIKLAVEKVRGRASLSVDTAIVDQYPDLITALGVPNALVTSPEGKFSCYIDAVDRLIGPSSYVEKTTMTPLPQTVDDFKAVFAGY